MSNERRHPQYDDIERRLRNGESDTAIARALGINRHTAAGIRRGLGLTPTSNATSMTDKLSRFSTPPDAAGHVLWTGRRGSSGTPVLRHRDVTVPAAVAAFLQRTGRQPVGNCYADCGTPHCIASAHVLDDIERRAVRMQMRGLYGLDPQPWDHCWQGHDWDAHGRLQPDLTPYCKTCYADRARTRRQNPDEGTVT